MIRSVLFLIILMMIISCKEKTWTVTKLLYFTVYGVTYDSLSNPHLGINRYLEFNDKGQNKMARGKIYSKTESAPNHGLEIFTELKLDEKSISLIQETLGNKDYDSTYNSHWEPRCCYFLYETSDNKKKIITFGTNETTPYELEELMHHLEYFLEYQYRYKRIGHFSVDSMVLKLESEIFINYPPPPKPIME